MRRNIFLIITIFLCVNLSSLAYPLFPFSTTPGKRINEIIGKTSGNFMRIRDATADMALTFNLHLFGCAGGRTLHGKGYFKYPDKLYGNIDKDIYYTRGNRIRRIDKDGKKFYVQLIHSLDFSPGYHPGLIPYNFYLTLIKDDAEDIVLSGTPKPGVLKNVTKVLFHIDPKEYILRKLDVSLRNNALSGSIFIDYKNIGGVWVPVAVYGKSAVEVSGAALIGLSFSLRAETMRINTGLPDRMFEPGF